MSSVETHHIVMEELRHIPRGTLAQNAFRTAYSAYREHDLRMNQTACAEAALADAETLVRQSQAGFIPDFDRSYFCRSAPCLCVAS